MSRVGKYPVKIIEGVSVEIKDTQFFAKGKIGENTVNLCADIDVKIADGFVTVSLLNEDNRAMWGTIRALINNAIIGAAQGFEKSLLFQGVGYKVALKGDILDMVIGYSHNVEYKIPAGVKCEVVSPTEVKLTSASKELVGLVASEIRKFRVPEPYKGKGIRYKGEYVRRKEGKKK